MKKEQLHWQWWRFKNEILPIMIIPAAVLLLVILFSILSSFIVSCGTIRETIDSELKIDTIYQFDSNRKMVFEVK